VEGESLRDRLDRETQLPVEEAVRIAIEVADALAYSHGQGVVHRDIKPENILLSGGHALVADFGIARALGQAGAVRLTETGMTVGTAAYMSPEQASGERQLDGRSDVYSLGCVLYEMLAGEPPYTGPTAQAIMAKRFSDPVPSVRRLRGAISPALDQAVIRALAPLPADRFATAAEFRSVLQAPVVAATTTTVPVATAASPARRGRIRLGLAGLGVGALITLGVVVARNMSGPVEGEPDDARVVAVLPFENLGAGEDEDFSDGMTDEVRSRLSSVPGVVVIARGSSMGYKKTSKTQKQIAGELGVEYLLSATVRWDESADGQRRVRVTPELVHVGGDGPPKTTWQQSFAAPVTDAFQVYADIAGRVAQTLGVAFGDSVRRRLATKPTEERTAYDAYLRGEAVSQSLGLGDPATLRKAMSYYEKAVALDSTFLQAWTQVSRAHSLLYFNSTPTPETRESARLAAERSLALAPDRPEGHIAMGTYFYMVVKNYARAEQEFARARLAAPNDADLLATSALAEMALGEWETALANLRRARALDPRSITTASAITWALLHLRRYPEAREAADRALTLAPADPALLQHKAMVLLAEGDLAGARGVLTTAPPEVDTAALFTTFVHYFELSWVLNDAQQRLVLRSTPSDFGDDRGAWAYGLAQIHRHRGDLARARAYADSSCTAVEAQLRVEPDDAQRHELYGICLAFLGRRNEAVREGQRAVALLPVAKDANLGAYLQHQLVRIYLLVGEPENALDQLEPLLEMPYYLSPGWLEIDPAFDPLQGNPRFQRLVNRSGRNAVRQ
jgi:serine/threonine-protein kinase